MIDKNKTYNKEEFKNIIANDFTLGNYTADENGQLFERYIYADKNLTGEEAEALDNGELGIFWVSNIDQLGLIEEEALARVWLDRNLITPEEYVKNLSLEDRKNIILHKKDIIDKYKIDMENCDNFYHGYWSGILALCRYISAGSEFHIDDLRSGDGLLDS